MLDRIPKKFPTTIPGYFLVSLLIGIIIITYVVIVGIMISKLDKDEIPGKFLSINIYFVDKFNKFIKETVGIRWRTIAPFLFVLSAYLGIANLSGIFGVVAPTSKTAITLSLAVFALIGVHYTGVQSKKMGHVKGWFEPISFMFPLNIVSDISPLLSMTFRLFGNIVSGGVLLTFIYHYMGFAAVIVSPILHTIFDIAFGAIQALVFVMLTLIYTSQKVKGEEIYQDTDENFVLEYNHVYKNQENTLVRR